MTDHVYHWKHGWIPLDHAAALSKAKGNHEAAKRMLADAHGHDAGIRNRRDVAKAATELHTIHDTADRSRAAHQLTSAARATGNADLLPGAVHAADELASRRQARAEQTPREIHERLLANPSSVNMDELQRLSRLGGKFAPAANAEIARRDDAQMKREGRDTVAEREALAKAIAPANSWRHSKK